MNLKDLIEKVLPESLESLYQEILKAKNKSKKGSVMDSRIDLYLSMMATMFEELERLKKAYLENDPLDTILMINRFYQKSKMIQEDAMDVYLLGQMEIDSLPYPPKDIIMH
jgi:hypothetical protein